MYKKAKFCLAAARTTETDHHLLNQRLAEERVAGFLLDLSDRLSRRGLSGIEINLTLSRSDIGNYLRLTMETVSRLLKSFESMGLITVSAKSIRILDKDKLRDLFNKSSSEGV